ncbi:hypothetical protein Hc94105_1205 [Helicobacter cinaedi]|uniref:autotransporter outer membrane beta-barrel domain-containing protein n=2 Tax=Helicobacter cinaedi TaxID=213 RepID=UPI001F2485A2|nr:autotransporter outer membrane beta-barrel domain-containing protein [Helicobacter cinaedi]BDB67002.1 hypothetical protein Hc94105_1205 [Helicobacter cinaedi]
MYPNNYGWNNANDGHYGDTRHYEYESVAIAYRPGGLNNTNFYFHENAKIDHFEFNYKKVGEGDYVWQNMSKRNDKKNHNITVGTLDTKGDLRFEVKLGGSNNTITTINNSANRLSLMAETGDALAVTTLNQQGGSGDGGHSELVLQNGGGSITIENLNQSGGTTYQKDGDVTTATIVGGHYYQGYGPTGGSSFGPTGDGGQIGTLNLQGGDFTQYAGQITTANLSGGTFIHNGGTLTSITLKGGGSGSTFINGSSTAIATINQEGGNHAVAGKITDFNLKGGSVSNKGEITNLKLTSANATLHNSGVITNLISGTTTTTKAFRATANKHISNAGTIDKLELNEATNVTNSGTIKELNVNKGNSTINTLTGVAQNPDTKLSNINIKANDAKLTVDTLSVGLDGNNAIKRVEINGNTGGNGGGKEFAVNKIQVSYINGTFDPTQNISNQLKDYVSNGVSQSYIDGNSKPTFEASPELEGGPGIKFNPDGTPYFDPQDSISASMTSMILRQSLRRKMLLDTYLAEQSRRSLKNKERRTRQRLEKATLGEARAKYEADLAVYNRLKMEWDKLANTKQNKAIIAKYEKDEKDYQKALKQYEQDYKQYEQESKKLEELAKATNIKIPVEPKAPIRPNVKPNDKNYKKLMSAYEKEEKAYQKALKKYEEDYKRYDQKIKRFEILARVSNLKAPAAPKKPNVKSNDKNYKKLMAGYEKARKDYQQSLKTYEQEKKNLEVLAKAHKIDIKIPVEPKAPIKPDVKPSDKDYKKLMVAYEKEQKAYQKALKQYEQDYKQYEQESKKLEELANAQKAKTKAPVEPKAPAIPAILASKPIAPIEPKLGEVSAELVAEHEVKGDFFVRAYGGTGTHSLNNGAQTTSWSAGTLLGANWNLALGQTSGNIGFYGGYEYIHNGYEQAHINAQGHNGFVGLRFSHLFIKTKLAGFYYIADVNGGYTNIDVSQSMNNMLYSANVGNINIGASFRLASAVYMYGSKSILFPSLGVGVDGGYLGEFEMKTNKAGELRYGGLGQPYAVTYAQANLNYYQEWGKRFSTTLGGGIRYLLNNDVSIMPTLNGKTYRIDEQTGKVASAHLAPFFYQGTFMVNYHTDNAGNLSAGYVAVGGEKGLTHNISARWHYFF